MTNWTETYRGGVPPWQCDVTEHFTVAYYFDRLEEADANLADELGLVDLPRRTDVPRRINARFVRELRAGASFHVESAALSVDDGLHLGHRFCRFRPMARCGAFAATVRKPPIVARTGSFCGSTRQAARRVAQGRRASPEHSGSPARRRPSV